MSIAAMRRVTLCGLDSDKGPVLAALQALGVMHLVPLRQAPPLEPRDPVTLHRSRTAAQHLRDSADQRLPYPLSRPFDLDAVVEPIFANRARLRALRDRRDELQQRIAATAPFGDLHLPPLAELGGQRFWFYLLPVRQRGALHHLTLPWCIVCHEAGALHVVVLAPEEPDAGMLPVPRVAVGSVPRSVLQAELAENAIAIEQAQAERAELTRWRLALGAHLAAAGDAEDLRAAAAQTLEADGVSAVQGWVPAAAAPAVEALARTHHLAAVVERPGSDDRPPTLLHQPGPMAGGADLTGFYASPAYHAWDPSIVVFISFSLFFAMILADAGYAVLLALLTGWLWSRLGASGTGRRMRVLMASIAGTALVYGVLAGSYFGVPPPQDSVLAALHVVDVHNFDAMMALSVAVGAVHISVALGTVAWLNRRRGAGIAALGWIIVIWSGMLLWRGHGPTPLGIAAESLGGAGLIAGLLTVFFGTAADRPAANALGWVKRAGSGAMAMVGITRLFSDLLSYLRLFALGLASASLAATFNSLAAGLHHSRPGIGLLLAIVVLLLGHGINLLLGLMGGVVHGLRLNFIEFFGWAIPDEGYPFRAFAKREVSE